jgi:hypothetical protein
MRAGLETRVSRGCRRKSWRRAVRGSLRRERAAFAVRTGANCAETVFTRALPGRDPFLSVIAPTGLECLRICGRTLPLGLSAQCSLLSARATALHGARPPRGASSQEPWLCVFKTKELNVLGRSDESTIRCSGTFEVSIALAIAIHQLLTCTHASTPASSLRTRCSSGAGVSDSGRRHRCDSTTTALREKDR